MERRKIRAFVKFLNAIEILGVCFIILVALYFQFILGEIPCPLCLLQRLGLLGIAFGFLLNIRYHVQPSHYSLSLLSAILTAFVSLRQIALHITSTGGYGSAVLGYHMYTWVFILCCVAIIYIAIVMSFPRQYELKTDRQEISEAKSKKVRAFTHIAFIILLIVVAINLISTFAECGWQQCPDNPVGYQLFHK
ncbi:disulfide bond formation protein B [Facilibium subflavum]|uniref:disulfide bond formation protein B n=1 Tax=Facilibium subflavum TaxID=2219058 RepID=UPI000E64C409|nr:disulfide bond formation protein B [Facilibium subflavum]